MMVVVYGFFVLWVELFQYCESGLAEIVEGEKMSSKGIYATRKRQTTPPRPQKKVGHCNVPQRHEANLQLGLWVMRQREELMKYNTSAGNLCLRLIELTILMLIGK